jgi:hypothetical protein
MDWTSRRSSSLLLRPVHSAEYAYLVRAKETEAAKRNNPRSKEKTKAIAAAPTRKVTQGAPDLSFGSPRYLTCPEEIISPPAFSLHTKTLDILFGSRNNVLYFD